MQGCYGGKDICNINTYLKRRSNMFLISTHTPEFVGSFKVLTIPESMRVLLMENLWHVANLKLGIYEH